MSLHDLPKNSNCPGHEADIHGLAAPTALMRPSWMAALTV
jgi:hypothetical protein